MFAIDLRDPAVPVPSPVVNDPAPSPDPCQIELLADDTGQWVDYRFIQISDRLAGTLGLDQPLGRQMRALYAAPCLQELAAFGRVLASGLPERLDYQLPGSERLFRLFASRAGSADERRIAVLIDDVTEWRRTEASLRAAEGHFRFLDALGRGIGDARDADVILATTTRMLGEHLAVTRCAYADLEPDQDGFTIRGHWMTPGTTSVLGGYRLSDFGHQAVETLRRGEPLVVADAIRDLPVADAAAFQRLGIRAIVCLGLIKDGQLTALMALHSASSRDWHPEEIALVSEVTDRSWAHIERVRAEAAVRAGERRFLEKLEAQVIERTRALQRSEKSLRAVLETTHLYQGLVSTAGLIEYANAASLEAIGQRLEDVAGKPLWEADWFTSTPGVAERLRQAVARVADRASAESATLMLSFDGSERSFDFSLRPVLGEAGVVDALLFEAIETTTRFKAEQALVQARKLEAIGRLTGGIAHDFNNLLMAVLGSLELLRKRCAGQLESLKLITNALRAVDRGASLTSRMLAFARRQDLKTEAVGIANLIHDMQDLIQRSIGPMITIDTRWDRHLPLVQTDINQLESALLNLVINARDALAGQGRILICGRAVEVTGHPQLTPGRYVALSVTDDGTGMSPETLGQAFEPFFTTKAVGQGTGLGLSMVLGLAEQCGGTLTLESHQGIGTTATIWLPAADSRTTALPIGATATVPSDNATGSAGSARSGEGRFGSGVKDSLHRLRVLAVDDDDLILAGTVAMLEDLGHHVATASSGALALDLLERHEFDLLLTDHAMPGMSGLQLADMIRARDPDLPIVLMTGFADLPPDDVRVGGTELPRLSKPFWQAELEGIVDSTSRQRRRPASALPGIPGLPGLPGLPGRLFTRRTD